MEMSACNAVDNSSNTTKKPFSELKVQQTIPGWDPMASEDTWMSHFIDINDLDLSTSNIYIVPKNLRKLNEEAYTPQSISIGPHHLGTVNLMQKEKARYFHSFMLRVSSRAMDNFRSYLESSEQVIRRIYATKFPEISDKKFVEMLLLDSVFIMELFTRVSRKEEDEEDGILKQVWLKRSIQMDLMLLENQIPFFILDELYSNVVPLMYQKHEKFIDLACEYFQCLDPLGNGSTYGPQEYGISEVKHFTDLIRYIYIRKYQKKLVPPLTALRSATKLQDAGIIFEAVEKKKLLDIELLKLPISGWTWFESRLKIPQLMVNQSTECVLRNLIAFEQCHYPDKQYIGSYVSFLDSLIDTDEDLKLLVDKEIIVHKLGNYAQVGKLIGGLCKNVESNATCYEDIIDALDAHYDTSWWDRQMAKLRLVYFRDLWRGTSTVIGVAVVIFTFLQFYQVFRDVFYVDKLSVMSF